MKTQRTNKHKLSEAQIDELVTAQADKDRFWDKPIHVQRSKALSVKLTSELMTRAVFFAQLHREASLESWLNRVILERLEMEEAAFNNIKRAMAEQQSA